ncbi:MAG: ATPase domain-containing protein [Promethearchaeati archaeon SRVP18_Atabeyarchaeia-1]
MAGKRVLQTGISKLDEIIGGGLLTGHYIVLGEPGSGYEIMTRQILVNALKQGRSGIYIAVDSSPERIKKEMNYFGWDLKRFEETGKFRFVDCSIYWLGLEQSPEKFFVRNLKNMDDFRSAIIMARDEVGVDGVGVTETFSTLVNHLGFEKALTLFNFLQGRLEQSDLVGLTMITSDSLPKEQVMSFSAVADGIIEMRIEKSGSTPARKMRIEKYGPEHEFTDWFQYEITHEGVRITGSIKERIRATLDRF